MKRVVLTGVTGFVGRELPALLRELGFQVHGVGRTEAAPASEVIHHSADLLRDDPEALMRRISPTHLLHLAWYAEPGRFWDAPANLDWVAASLRLARAFSRAGGKRAVFAGSCAEYDWSVPHLDERSTQLTPGTLYGEAKAGLFRILSRAAPVLGLSFAWGRIFFPYGPFEKEGRLLGSLFDGIAREQPVSFSAGTQERDFMHVEDVAAAFAQLLDSEVTGPVNIASGKIIAIRNLVERAARLAGGEHLISFGERPLQAGEPPVMSAAVERLHEEVRFRPRFSLDDGLRDMLQRRPIPLQQESFF